MAATESPSFSASSRCIERPAFPHGELASLQRYLPANEVSEHNPGPVKAGPLSTDRHRGLSAANLLYHFSNDKLPLAGGNALAAAGALVIFQQFPDHLPYICWFIAC